MELSSTAPVSPVFLGVMPQEKLLGKVSPAKHSAVPSAHTQSPRSALSVNLPAR